MMDKVGVAWGGETACVRGAWKSWSAPSRAGRLHSAHLVLHELGRIIQHHLLSLGWGVAGGQGQAAQGVTASAPLLDHGHDLLLHRPSHGHPGGAYSHVVAAVDDSLGGTLGDQERAAQRATGCR